MQILQFYIDIKYDYFFEDILHDEITSMNNCIFKNANLQFQALMHDITILA